jgi:hypothetical protein
MVSARRPATRTPGAAGAGASRDPGAGLDVTELPVS